MWIDRWISNAIEHFFWVTCGNVAQEQALSKHLNSDYQAWLRALEPDSCPSNVQLLLCMTSGAVLQLSGMTTRRRHIDISMGGHTAFVMRTQDIRLAWRLLADFRMSSPPCLTSAILDVLEKDMISSSPFRHHYHNFESSIFDSHNWSYDACHRALAKQRSYGPTDLLSFGKDWTHSSDAPLCRWKMAPHTETHIYSVHFPLTLCTPRASPRCC